MLRCNDATMLRCYDATLLRCYDATMLRCYDATILRCDDAPLVFPPKKQRGEKKGEAEIIVVKETTESEKRK
ncbi:hypothetical protein POVWA2_039760 [Plasmodium ovale wallikeri]|uniref:Uncharacterized protein n=1 Tax=Plasmodium ovale wallikeri TaxID=864142 RepID=A0A1A8Z9H7_PLAOA|nr:hypothetical protein POVWA2_039760 [Plasmodium ovale wallikeri]